MNNAICGMSVLGFIYENAKGIGALAFAAMLLSSFLIAMCIDKK